MLLNKVCVILSSLITLHNESVEVMYKWDERGCLMLWTRSGGGVWQAGLGFCDVKHVSVLPQGLAVYLKSKWDTVETSGDKLGK